MAEKGREGAGDGPKIIRDKGDGTPGAICYTVLRLADLPLQWYLISNLGPRLLRSIGGTAVASRVTAPSIASTSFLTSRVGVFGLTPYHTVILGLATGSALKHVWWSWSIRNYIFPPKLASYISGYNTALNTLNALLSLWVVTSNSPFQGLQSPPQTWGAVLDPRNSTVPIGLVLYVIGMTIEVVAEIQRKAFKDKPENKDKPFAGGLFGYARNINYGGYLLWRIGYATVCAGLPWGLVAALQQGSDFIYRAIPGMNMYCATRYGSQWDSVREKVPYKLLPYIY